MRLVQRGLRPKIPAKAHVVKYKKVPRTPAGWSGRACPRGEGEDHGPTIPPLVKARVRSSGGREDAGPARADWGDEEPTFSIDNGEGYGYL